MNGYCNRGDLRRSFSLLEDMRARKIAPNAVIYNTLLKGYARKGDIEGLKQVRGKGSLSLHLGVTDGRGR